VHYGSVHAARPRRGPVAALAAAGVILALLAAPASARWYGSTLQGTPNAGYGCETATVRAPLGGVQRSPTNQTSCTYRHGGYLYSTRPTFIAPGTGKVTRIRVKSGPNPARLRLTVLTGSSRVDPFTGRDQPGTYTCCTARYIGRAFRPRANRVTKKRVNVRVYDVRNKELQYRIHSSDGLALTAVGSGTLPLRIRQDVGGFNAGTPLATGYWPHTRKGDPRSADGYTMTGIDLLFQWNWRRR
jgi:hypothetical protein